MGREKGTKGGRGVVESVGGGGGWRGLSPSHVTGCRPHVAVSAQTIACLHFNHRVSAGYQRTLASGLRQCHYDSPGLSEF